MTGVTTHMFVVTADCEILDCNLDLFVEAETPIEAIAIWRRWAFLSDSGLRWSNVRAYTVPNTTGEMRYVPWDNVKKTSGENL